jgi:hypothetical protein
MHGHAISADMNWLSLPKWVFVILIFCGASGALFCQTSTPTPEKNAFENSLHYTNRGFEFKYAKEHGGLERITSIPFSQLSCSQCHVGSCDTCHAKQIEGKTFYSTEVAKSEVACVHCHDFESRTLAQKNPHSPDVDVHFARGMKCMDCHSAREIHGDGTAYDSIQAPGAMDARCENCHRDLSRCPSSAVHNGKVHCNACHTRQLSSCINCHFDTRIKEGKSSSLPLQDALFLINDRRGTVTTAVVHTFVYQNRTMIVFAPSFGHSIMKQGRKCGDCHATPVIQALQKGAFQLAAWDKTELKNRSGVIPVAEGYNWNFPFLNYVDGHWTPADKPIPPVLNYADYSKPITQGQLEKLARPHQP